MKRIIKLEPGESFETQKGVVYRNNTKDKSIYLESTDDNWIMTTEEPYVVRTETKDVWDKEHLEKSIENLKKEEGFDVLCEIIKSLGKY